MDLSAVQSALHYYVSTKILRLSTLDLSSRILAALLMIEPTDVGVFAK